VRCTFNYFGHFKLHPIWKKNQQNALFPTNKLIKLCCIRHISNNQVFIIRNTCTVSFTVSWTYIGSLFAIRLCLIQHQNSRKYFHKLNRCCCTKVNQSLYIPAQAIRVPGSWGFQMSRQSAHEIGKLVRLTHWPSLPSTSGCISGTHFW
jgi:hypothetical protein